MKDCQLSASAGRSRRTIWLWFGLVVTSVLLMVLIEAASLVILYLHDSARVTGSTFLQNHLLTSIFVHDDSPVQGKRFVGYLSAESADWKDLFLPDPVLGWRLARNVVAIHNWTYMYETDASGFVAEATEPPVAVEKPDDVYRVIVLGGSTVFGQGAPRPSENLVAKLRSAIGAGNLVGQNGKAVQMINAGVGGYNSGQEYLYLLDRLLRYRPDLVVVYDGWNDSTYVNEAISRWGIASPAQTVIHPELEERLDATYRIGGSLRLALTNVETLLANSARPHLGAAELIHRLIAKTFPVPPKRIAFHSDSVVLYKLNWENILALGQIRGFQVALFLQPISGIDGKTLSVEERAAGVMADENEMKYRGPFYVGARKMVEDLKVQHQPPADCIADISGVFQGIDETVYADSGHLLPKGNAIVADRMIKELYSCGFLRTP